MITDQDLYIIIMKRNQKIIIIFFLFFIYERQFGNWPHLTEGKMEKLVWKKSRAPPFPSEQT